ncbi:MAG: hypothetical protein ACRD2L_01180, partial [Terriglobia bacterium]
LNITPTSAMMAAVIVGSIPMAAPSKIIFALLVEPFQLARSYLKVEEPGGQGYLINSDAQFAPPNASKASRRRRIGS